MPRYRKVGQFITAVLFNSTFRTTGFGSFNPGFESFERTPVYRTSVYNPTVMVEGYKRILVEIVVYERGWVTLSTNLGGMGCRPLTTVGVRKLEFLGCHVVLFA